MKKIILHEAFEELQNAIAYYEEQQAGLGLRLKQEFDRHIYWIMGNSTVPRIRSGGYRRVNLKMFPYYIAYIIRGDTLWILAVAHAHRRPEYWIGRENKISA
uniref:ParE toxin of type II toxin-antitoxin system, parDE n=1 Tax=Candidatus Kentrum sp. FW TaxID=2126338 RepID=A0A450RVL8_9GAMM|nr:MAG: ParE toxin of type II toxin-antitoxin system, parDE [Candidatus Kentron sp. FW]VFJ68965.1 MAG: ParE toxin of type II toxin-antitoxin system, parDE [Candidatus Kentron sp. FW]VFJ69712.1 MAG: ParE toxin of type II toxin-antitoxin system, parDE [Candidatus Kentron sp. FW]